MNETTNVVEDVVEEISKSEELAKLVGGFLTVVSVSALGYLAARGVEKAASEASKRLAKKFSGDVHVHHTGINLNETDKQN